MIGLRENMRYIFHNDITPQGSRFVIYPPNSRTQFLGASPWYSSIDECKKAKHKFLSLIYNKHINSVDDSYVKIKREMAEHKDKSINTLLVPNYKFYYYDENNELIFFREKGFCQMQNCKKCLISIYNAVKENYN